MTDIEYEYSHSSYECRCPLPASDEEEIELARACHERELAHEAAQRGDREG